MQISPELVASYKEVEQPAGATLLEAHRDAVGQDAGKLPSAA